MASSIPEGGINLLEGPGRPGSTLATRWARSVAQGTPGRVAVGGDALGRTPHHVSVADRQAKGRYHEKLFVLIATMFIIKYCLLDLFKRKPTRIIMLRPLLTHLIVFLASSTLHDLPISPFFLPRPLWPRKGEGAAAAKDTHSGTQTVRQQPFSRQAHKHLHSRRLSAETAG